MSKVYVGAIFTRLTVMAYETTVKHYTKLWRCLCSCGNQVIVRENNLVSGNTKSCGCLNSELASERITSRLTEHGHSWKGGGTREYNSWCHMKQRCLNPNNHAYEQYGGRGITIAKEWVESFSTFLRDMGARPRGTTLDRIDVNGNYTPNNCRWATPLQQQNNRRVTIKND